MSFLYAIVNFENDDKRHTLLMGVQGGSNMTGTDLRVYKPHCAAAVRP